MVTIDTLLPPESEDFARREYCLKDKSQETRIRTTYLGLPARRCLGECNDIYLDNKTIRENLGDYQGSI